MNWYCKIKLAQYSHPSSYTDVGHYGTSADCNEWLWAFINGSLEVRENARGVMHTDFWPADVVEASYRGRYDECRKQISILVPEAFAQRQVPTSLIRMVERQFPEAVGTYVFSGGTAVPV